MAKRKLLFEGRLSEAMAQMRVHERLHGSNYTSADEFVAELGKYVKFHEVCDHTELEKCLGKEWSNGTETIEIKDLAKSKATAIDQQR